MARRKRLYALLEAVQEVLRIDRKRLAGDCLHQREQVIRAVVHLVQQQTDFVFLALALRDVQAAAKDPEWLPPILIVAEVCTSDPSHPAHLAAWSHEAEVHLNLTGVGPACSPFVLLADPGLIVPVHARKRRFDACGLNPRKSEDRRGLWGVTGAIRFKIDREGADAGRFIRKAQPLFALAQCRFCPLS